jgi:hypothetical protein
MKEIAKIARIAKIAEISDAFLPLESASILPSRPPHLCSSAFQRFLGCWQQKSPAAPGLLIER